MTPTLTHICLSDLHFGAETSLLTELDQNHIPRYQAPSPVLLRLIECLRELTHRQPPDRRPTLVLAGDILELALSNTHEAAMTFELFLTQAFPGGGKDLFARDLVYVPGNHDHHLWEMARETQFLDYLRQVPAGQPLGAEWHITRLYLEEGGVYPEQRLLSALARRHPALSGLRMSTAYPNMGICARDGRRSVVFTHGHYVEPLYTLISELKQMLFPHGQLAETVMEIEAENFAWIDFFWSTMGRSGDAGLHVQKIYEMIGTEGGRQELRRNLGSGIVQRFFGDDWIPNSVQRWTLDAIIDAVSERATTRERGLVAEPLGEAATAGLARYISGPLRRQILHECRDRQPPESVAVVFGHTHKPFERIMGFEGYEESVEVYNTGGWVVDTVPRQPLHGGAIVVVDRDGHCASLRMYNEGDEDGVVPMPRVATLQDNPLGQALQRMIDARPEPWLAFGQAVRTGIAIRADALDRRSRQ